jgi:hypothetical protein
VCASTKLRRSHRRNRSRRCGGRPRTGSPPSSYVISIGRPARSRHSASRRASRYARRIRSSWLNRNALWRFPRGIRRAEHRHRLAHPPEVVRLVGTDRMSIRLRGLRHAWSGDRDTRVRMTLSSHRSSAGGPSRAGHRSRNRTCGHRRADWTRGQGPGLGRRSFNCACGRTALRCVSRDGAAQPARGRERQADRAGQSNRNIAQRLVITERTAPITCIQHSSTSSVPLTCPSAAWALERGVARE